MTDKEKLDLVYKKFKKLHAGLFGVKFYLDKPFPDDDRWTPWTRFIEPYLKMMSVAFEGEDIGELSVWAELGEQEVRQYDTHGQLKINGDAWYAKFYDYLTEPGNDEVKLGLELDGVDVLRTVDVMSAAKKAAGID